MLRASTSARMAAGSWTLSASKTSESRSHSANLRILGFASRRVADGRIESGWSSEGLGQAVKLTGKSNPRAAKGSSGSPPFPPLPHIGAKRVAIDDVIPMSAKASDNVSATAFSEPGFIPPLEASVNRIPLAELWQDHTIAIQNVTAEASQKMIGRLY